MARFDKPARHIGAHPSKSNQSELHYVTPLF
jgi:hypothetical protein